VQALNDTCIFLGVTLATLFSGKLVNALGWQTVNLYTGLPIALLVSGLLLLMRRTD
jgi:predicted MFS family arabinose efflux permease